MIRFHHTECKHRHTYFLSFITVRACRGRCFFFFWSPHLIEASVKWHHKWSSGSPLWEKHSTSKIPSHYVDTVLSLCKRKRERKSSSGNIPFFNTQSVLLFLNGKKNWLMPVVSSWQQWLKSLSQSILKTTFSWRQALCFFHIFSKRGTLSQCGKRASGDNIVHFIISCYVLFHCCQSVMGKRGWNMILILLEMTALL